MALYDIIIWNSGYISKLLARLEELATTEGQ
jgi:hypothetical protein